MGTKDGIRFLRQVVLDNQALFKKTQLGQMEAFAARGDPFRAFVTASEQGTRKRGRGRIHFRRA